jgi:hypothetical protein
VFPISAIRFFAFLMHSNAATLPAPAARGSNCHALWDVYLASELLVAIFEWLSVADVLRCRLVSRRWCAIASSKHVWRSFVRLRFRRLCSTSTHAQPLCDAQLSLIESCNQDASAWSSAAAVLSTLPSADDADELSMMRFYASLYQRFQPFHSLYNHQLPVRSHPTNEQFSSNERRSLRLTHQSLLRNTTIACAL